MMMMMMMMNYKHRSVVWCKVYFDIVNRLGVTRECDRQTDGQTGYDRLYDSKFRASLGLRCAAKKMYYQCKATVKHYNYQMHKLQVHIWR